MTTKQRFRGKYRLEIREKDHHPMHVHLSGGAIDVIIDLETMQAHGLWPASLRDEVMAWVTEHRKELIQEWKKCHP